MLSHSAAQFLLPEQIEKCFQKLSDKKKNLSTWTPENMLKQNSSTSVIFNSF